MKFKAIHQVAAGFASGDAISLEAVEIRGILRDMGFSSEIYVPAASTAPDCRDAVRPLEEYKSSDSDLLIYHYSIQTPATEVFRRTCAKTVVIYHNITPASFFRAFDERLARRLELARRELAEIAGRADAVWADSAFNASEIAALGAKKVRVLPLLFSARSFDAPADPAMLRRWSAPSRKILFVGRMAPNKCVEELIEAFAWYHKGIERRSELILIGSERSCPRYFAMLRMFAAELDLMPVSFVRYASPAGLNACYQKADLFVSASRHEGYCLPVVEAMYKGVPVIARGTGGVPEAMGGAGVMYDEASPEELAALMARALSDEPLRAEILVSQQKRIQSLLDRPVADEVRALLDEL